jgi:hypothetical protein
MIRKAEEHYEQLRFFQPDQGCYERNNPLVRRGWALAAGRLTPPRPVATVALVHRVLRS